MRKSKLRKMTGKKKWTTPEHPYSHPSVKNNKRNSFDSCVIWTAITIILAEEEEEEKEVKEWMSKWIYLYPVNRGGHLRVEVKEEEKKALSCL